MVKQGYKQTEIGIIPNDWKITSLQECVKQNLSYGVNAPAVSYDSHLPTYIRITDITADGQYDSSNKVSVLLDSYEKYVVEENDILLARTGASTGKSYIYNEKDGSLVYAGFLIRARVNPKVANAKYIFAQLHTDRYWKWVNSTSQRSGQPGINGKEYGEFLFPYPQEAEQTAIAAALSDTDALIDSLEKLIAKKQAIKQGTMQELLTGKRRLKGFSGEWNYRNFVDTFDFLPNNTYSRDKMTNSVGEYINIHYGDVLIKYGAILDLEKDESPYLAEGVKITNKKMLARDGDIIIADTAEDNTVGKMIELLRVGKQKVVSGLHTILCRPKYDEFSPRWLGYFMNSESYHEQLLPFITGKKVSSVAKSSIGETIISIPDKEEQQAIAQILTDMDDEISALQKKLDKLRRIKQGMMAELLTGRIRLI